MRRLWWVVLLGLASVLRPAFAETLNFYNWNGYTAPALIEKFERETGIKVNLTTYESYLEAVGTLRSGNSGFDVSVISDYDLQDLVRRGLVEKIDAYKLDGFANIEVHWRSRKADPRNEYSVPWHWGTTSFVVDTALYKGNIDTLALLFNPPPELAGRLTMLDSADIVQLALIYLGKRPCSTDPADLRAAAAAIAPLLRKGMVTTLANAVPDLTASRSAIGVAWNGDALRARLARPTLRYAYPREGMPVWSDMAFVPRNPPHRAAALRFMEFLLRPENMALQSNFSYYANSIHGSDRFLEPILLSAPETIVPSSIHLNFFQSCTATEFDIQQRLALDLLAPYH